MEVTIQYSGRLANRTLQARLLKEIILFCKHFGWRYEQILPPRDDQEHPPVHGLLLMPHEKCETMSLLFDAAGHLVHVAALAAYDPQIIEQRKVSVRTSRSTPDVHIIICKVLNFMKEKYMADLRVVDSSDYWSLQDRALLEHFFRLATRGAEPNPPQKIPIGVWSPSESGERLIARVEKFLENLMTGDDPNEPKDDKDDISGWDISLN